MTRRSKMKAAGAVCYWFGMALLGWGAMGCVAASPASVTLRQVVEKAEKKLNEDPAVISILDAQPQQLRLRGIKLVAFEEHFVELRIGHRKEYRHRNVATAVFIVDGSTMSREAILRVSEIAVDCLRSGGFRGKMTSVQMVGGGWQEVVTMRVR